jgi:SPP1 gp7 family putative phage head morphogenesis protein
VLNLIGQQDFGARELMKFADIQKVLEDAGIPILPFRQQQAREKQIADEQAAAQAPPTAPVPGQQVGVVPSSTGFSYIQPRNVIYLSDGSSSFLERLPSSHHYTDPKIRRAARELWQQWHDMYGEEYADFADFLAAQEKIEFADVTDDLRKAARRIVRSWEGRLQRLGKVLDRTTDIYKRVMNQASKVSGKDAGLDSSPTDAEIQSWIERHAGEFVSTVEFTTREELTDFLAVKLAEGVTDPKDLSQEVRDHFADFPGWKADRLARTEIRDAFNASTLLTAQANGVDQVQALDGTGDPDCAKRNGRVFPIDDAFLEREHPNGTLGWRILPVALSYRYTTEELPGGTSAIYDHDNNEIVFCEGVSEEQRGEYMLSVGDLLAGTTREVVAT